MPSTAIDPLTPEIFALEVNNGPVSFIRDWAICEFGILNPIVLYLIVRITVCFFEEVAVSLETEDRMTALVANLPIKRTIAGEIKFKKNDKTDKTDKTDKAN